MKGIHTISIVGTGNVAFHLGNSFFEQGITISSVFGRNQGEAEAFANQWKSQSVKQISELEADLILICVSDDAISSIIKQLPTTQKIAYTSGSIELSSFINHENSLHLRLAS
jgi:predicted dinucleotide-binding enzyme